MAGAAMTRRRARGSAVVLAMVLAALAAVVAVTVLADQQRWARTVEHRRDQVQAQALAMAGVQWAREILDEDALALDTSIISASRGRCRCRRSRSRTARSADRSPTRRRASTSTRWARTASPRTRRRNASRGCSRTLGGPLPAIDAIADWIDADGIPRAAGAEDAYYAAQPAPGLAANQPLVRVGELADVKGVDGRRGSRPSAPFLAALPANAAVNVNTAPPEVLATIVDGLTGDSLAALVATRAQKPFTTIAEFRARLPQGTSLRGDDALVVRSEYFLVTIVARQGSTIATARALLHRGAGAWPEIVWQVVD